MKNTMKNLVTLLTIALVVVFAPATARAASNYTMTYWANELVVYYTTDSAGSVRAVDARELKFNNNKVTLAGTDLATDRKTGTCPVWYEDYVCWITSSGVFKYYNFSTKATNSGVSNATELFQDKDGFLKNVGLSDGKQVAASVAVTGGSSTSSTPSTPTPATVTTGKVVIETSGGSTIYSFNGHKLVANGATFKLDGYNISERCMSGVRFAAVSSDNKVLLYEDASKIFYIFDVASPFTPEVIRMKTELISVNSDRGNGFLESITTGDGNYTLEQLIKSDVTSTVSAYVVNKVGYSTYYSGDTRYTLELSGSNLLFSGNVVKTVASGKDAGGLAIDKDSIYVLDGKTVYKAPVSNPTNWSVYKENVSKLEYSKANGFLADVSGTAPASTSTDTKKNYVKNSGKKAVLYQAGKKAHTVSINSKGTTLSLDGKVIQKWSAPQVKSGYRFAWVGFTKKSEIVVKYSTGSTYKATISSLKFKKVSGMVSVDKNGFATVK